MAKFRFTFVSGLTIVAALCQGQSLTETWRQSVIDPDMSPIHSVAAGVTNGVILHCLLKSNSGVSSSLVTKLDRNGVAQWSKKFSLTGETHPQQAWVVPCSDGSFWTAGQFAGVDRQGTLEFRHLAADGSELAHISRIQNWSYGDKTTLAIRAQANGGVALMWPTALTAEYLRLSATGEILAQTSWPGFPTRMAIEPDGDAYFTEYRPVGNGITFSLVKVTRRGLGAWGLDFVSPLKQVDDVCGLEIDADGTSAFLTVGVVQREPFQTWYRAMKIRAATGDIESTCDVTDLANPNTPAITTYPFGGATVSDVFTTKHVRRLSSTLQELWTVSLNAPGETYSDTGIDRFGNWWSVGQSGSPDPSYTVTVLSPNGSVRGRDRQSRDRAIRVAFDENGNAYVLSLAPQGIDVARYAALVAPIPVKR